MKGRDTCKINAIASNGLSNPSNTYKAFSAFLHKRADWTIVVG